MKWNKLLRINFMVRMKVVAMKCTFICSLIRDVHFCHCFSFIPLDILSLFKKLLRNENALSQWFLSYFTNPPTDLPLLCQHCSPGGKSGRDWWDDHRQKWSCREWECLCAPLLQGSYDTSSGVVFLGELTKFKPNCLTYILNIFLSFNIHWVFKESICHVNWK